MAEIEGGGRSEYTSIIGVLRSMLGDAYDDGPHADRDEVLLNIGRVAVLRPDLSDDEREAFESSMPDDVGAFANAVLPPSGTPTAQTSNMPVDFGGVTTPLDQFINGIRQDISDDDRTTIQDIINSRGESTLPGPGDRGEDDVATVGTGQTVTGEPVQAAGDGGDGGSGGGAGGPGGGGGDTWSTTDDSLPADGTPRQIPGGEELWHVDGKVYLAYKSPNGSNWLMWHVENPERLEAIYGDDLPAFDREMNQQQLEAMSPWLMGLSSEIQNTSEDPWTQFMSDFNEAAERRPWLNDPTMIATIAGAYLEGRDPTRDELAETDWWNDHTAEERAFMEDAVTAGRAQTREALREEARKWLGPEFGNMSDQQVDRWAKNVHEDPSKGDDFLRLLKKQRKALFPEYEDEELTYDDIVTPFRNLASNVWGQPVDDESMLVDLANTQDYTEASRRLRETGRKRGVEKVWNDMFGALGSTGVGERVVRSAI